MPPERVKMPMAPTFCLRSVFCTPARTAPTAVSCSAVLAVLARASRGWKVTCWSAMVVSRSKLDPGPSSSTTCDLAALRCATHGSCCATPAGYELTKYINMYTEYGVRSPRRRRTAPRRTSTVYPTVVPSYQVTKYSARYLAVDGWCGCT